MRVSHCCSLREDEAVREGLRPLESRLKHGPLRRLVDKVFQCRPWFFPVCYQVRYDRDSLSYSLESYPNDRQSIFRSANGSRALWSYPMFFYFLQPLVFGFRNPKPCNNALDQCHQREKSKSKHLSDHMKGIRKQ